jgi:hypothetical protein
VIPAPHRSDSACCVGLAWLCSTCLAASLAGLLHNQRVASQPQQLLPSSCALRSFGFAC